ncbi:MAG: hypothetical protein HFJ29_04950 [Clostridia bacterium]|nr:hypothetical protein [Clostridia bacterium]
MSEDMSDIIQKMSEMLKNNEMPDNIKSLMGQFASEQNSSSSPQGNSGNTTESSDQRSSNDSFEMPNIDIGTMLKMKSIIDSMNQQQNDPRANLLRSLKPYLKPSRKEKVDQYIKLFGMGKIFEVLNPLGGEKKNDV